MEMGTRRMEMRYFNKRNKRFTKQGFTILEVVIAIVLFGLLYAGLFNAIFIGLRMQPIIRTRIYGHNLMNGYTETLRSLPLEHTWFTNDGENNDLDNIEEPDFSRVDTFSISDSSNFIYDVMWNIAENVPENNMITIRIFVRRRNIMVTNDIVRWRGE